MVARHLSVIALSSLLTLTAAAQTGAGNPLTLQPGSRLWVEGTSTVRGFTCTAPSVNATIQTSSGGAVAATLAGEKSVSAVRIEVPSRSLDCANGTMNSHMFKALNAEQHPTIVFRMTSYDLTTVDPNTATVKLNGRLSLGGQEKPITMTAEAKQGPGGTLAGDRLPGCSTHRLRAPAAQPDDGHHEGGRRREGAVRSGSEELIHEGPESAGISRPPPNPEGEMTPSSNHESSRTRR
jgi:polyisoprenoid-binding protein YceI